MNASAHTNVSQDEVMDRVWHDLTRNTSARMNLRFDTMMSIFTATVTATPDATAILYFGFELSYRQLDELSDGFAGWLAESGFVRGGRVALVLQNLPQFPIACIGTWKAGGIVVPLNPMYRPAELSKLFADAGPAAVICEAHQAADIAAVLAELHSNTRVLPTRCNSLAANPDRRIFDTMSDGTDEFMEAVRWAGSLPRRETAVSPEDIAMILYTSGTTGTPRGAMLSHASLAFNAEISRVWFGISPAARILATAPLFHIIGFEVHLCVGLLVGGMLVMTYRLVPAVVLDVLLATSPEFMIGTITTYIALMNVLGVTRDHFASIRQAYSGGAPVPPPVVAQLKEKLGVSIRTAYGMTETAGPALVTPPDLASPVDSESGLMAIGMPVSFTDAKVVDDSGGPLPPGAAGELWLRGPQIMQGYWGRPHESAAARHGDWLRTGDIAVIDKDGWFYLVDRKKDMISASGFKVWPREVEDVIYGHPAVQEVAVVGVHDSYRGEDVKAFIVLKSSHAANSDDIIAFCREKLAAYKVPRQIEFLQALPKTASGKIQRAALRPAQ